MAKRGHRKNRERPYVPVFTDIPVFCDLCPSLAFAVVDESPVCNNCMVKLITGKDNAWITEHVRPLNIRSVDVAPITSPMRDDDSTQVA